MSINSSSPAEGKSLICEKHQKHLKFKCFDNECSNLMCSDCLKDEQFRASAIFYCHVCKSKDTFNRSVTICQPVTEIQDLTTVRVELFPINETETHNDIEQSSTIDPQVLLINEDLILTQTQNPNKQ